ncbi:MAG: response regulator [Desulfobacteraceae bacterium]|jgi:signal transduction histidine kinase
MTQNEKKAQAPRRIIIIDDNPDIHKDFATILTARSDLSQLEALESELFGTEQLRPKWGGCQFDLAFATQGREGLDKIKLAMVQQKPYQLAFVDMRMPPGWDGLKTIKEIWRVDPEIQIIICTAYSDYSWEEINQKLGITENLLILKKPFDSSEVAQLASTLTRKWILAKKAAMKRDELERLVTQRTKALKESNQHLKRKIGESRQLATQLVRFQKMEAVGTLAAGVAHDLNNILSGILSYPDLLLMNMREDDPMYHPLSVIRRSSHKAAAIVQDMLTLARRNVAVKEPVNFSTLILDFLDGPECRTILRYHPGVSIDSQIGSEPFMVLGSAVHLEKLVMNLISNAAESIKEKGAVTIRLSYEQLAGTLPGYGTVKPGSYVKLTVADQGTGIDQEDLVHIFEPFFTKKKLGRSGTGLGMTVVWDTVNDHQGYIEVDSKPGHGTDIAVYLPISHKQVENSTDESKKEDFIGQGERILVVDDMAEQREIATAIFKELGYAADAVTSGESALDYIEKQSVDLMLLDMIMDPGMDGLDTFKQVLSKYPDQKVLIASGYTKSDRVRTALQLGARFIQKPYRLKEIMRAVKNTLHAPSS